jgi:hypothetical protein
MPDEAREPAAEIAAILARLKEEIRGGASGSGGDVNRGASRPLAARAQAERTWAVTAERRFQQPPNRRGPIQAYVVVPVKRVLRKLMRWYVEPVAADQRTFNLAVLSLIDELAERIEAEVRRLEQRLETLEKRRLSDSAERRG